MSGDGLSGNEVPPQYGEPAPYYRKALTITLPAAILTVLLAGVAPAWACRALGQLGAAYAIGSNAWLLIYGSKMYRVCASLEWIGKEGFSTIQAALFPDFFAFQTAGCVVALGTYVGVSHSFDIAAGAMAASLALGLINLGFMGPKTNQLMLQLYSTKLMDDDRKAAKKKFGMVHGISMLVDLFALAGATAFLLIVAAK
eukprot:CAMPEP_0171197618 /NCGR_PEP_ID=MMETSP0790-20130122/22504_1 /TAXON_ID=2925 /ORGANISM="Alexandrium catenella, Strain OF101" /LENGTH=198 /DNA_ID=CAMNT_0011662865 /DNA_START=68 /DNA_END=664 /DNA_ORIENTATION=-